MKFLVLLLVVLMIVSLTLHDAYGCSGGKKYDYVLPWKYIYPDPHNCETQLTVSWIGLTVWIVMGFLLFNYALALLGKKTMWQKK